MSYRAWEPNAIGSVVPPFGGSSGGGGGSGITELTGDVLAGPGSGSQAATVVGLQGSPVSSTAPSTGQVLTWDGAAWVPSGRAYPDPSLAVLAWNFSGTAASIPNLGTLVSADANMSTIGSGVVRDVPGPVSSGVGAFGTANNAKVHTAQGAVNLGSALFTNEITMVIFFDLTTDPAAVAGEYNALVKGRTSGSWGAPIETAIGWFNGVFYGQVVVAGATYRQAFIAPGGSPAGSYGFRPGLHMAAYTYNGLTGTSRLYYDGVEVALKVDAPAAIELGLNVGVNEGPWNVGGNFATDNRGMHGIVYAVRVYNSVQPAAWIRQAWKNANGWL